MPSIAEFHLLTPRLVCSYTEFPADKIAHWNPSPLSINLMLRNWRWTMVIVWLGSLAVLLNKLWRRIIKPVKETYCIEDYYKRIGVYYMCIDDLPL